MSARLPLRVTPFHAVEIEGLGTELVACSERDAEFFAVEEQQADGRWLTVTDHPTRAKAEATDHSLKPLSDPEFDPLFADYEAEEREAAEERRRDCLLTVAEEIR